MEQAGLAYLARYSASTAHTRQVLARRIRRAGVGPEDAAVALVIIDGLIVRWVAAGILDDVRFAAAKAASLHRRGASRRGIAARLSQSGLDPGQIAAMASPDDAASPDIVRPGGDLAAALNLARRRRIGPYRPDDRPARAPEKDMAVFARAGFARAVARKILAATNPEMAEGLLRESQEFEV